VEGGVNATPLEKKQRRRESHNAVERRRRDLINEKIQELGKLLPEDMDGSGSSNPPELSAAMSGGSQSNTKDAKNNKGVILKRSVDYILQLQQSKRDLEDRERLLQQQTRDMEQRQRGLEELVTRLGGGPLLATTTPPAFDFDSMDSMDTA